MLMFFAGSVGWAQTSPTTGAIRGNVVDPSGAVVPNATVVLVNSNLAIHRETKTESDGRYLFPLVPPASGYELNVTVAGFAQAVVKDITVRITEINTTPPISLVVSTRRDEVIVVAASETVQTSDATTGNTLLQQVIEVLPLNTRNTIALLATDAGVAADSNNITIFAGGNRSTYNNYSLNGIDSNNFEFNSLGSVPSPNPDSVQEFRTRTSLYDASEGRNSGANITLLSRSGTSKIHGTVYEYNRNRDFAANNFFLNKAGIAAPPFLRNQFGGSAGGPLPDKKTFWFFNYEGTRQIQGTSINGFMPVLPSSLTPASLAAAFSVPQSAIDPVAVKVLNLPGAFGGKAFPSGIGAPVGQLGTFTYASSVRTNYGQMTIRVDRDFKLFGGTNRISGTFFRGTQAMEDNLGLSIGQLGSGGRLFNYNNGNYSINDTHIFNSNLLNEFSIGYTKFQIKGNNAVDPITLSQIGMSRFNQSLFPDAPSEMFSDQIGGFGTNPEAAPQQSPWTFSVRDSISQTHDKHTFRYGFAATRNAFNFHESYNFRGYLYYLPLWADILYGAPANPNQDISLRDFLIGAPTIVSASSGITDSDYRATDLSGFFQDNYRVTHRLTLNFGVRWEYYGNISEIHGNISSFDPSLVSPSNAQIGGPGILSGLLVPAGVSQFGKPGVSPSTLIDQDKKNFAPRFGFAYDVLGNARLAVRGGYGIYYNRISAMGPLQTSGQVPFGLTTTAIGYNGTQALNNPFPVLPLPNQFPVITPPAQLTGYDSSGNPVFTNDNLLTLISLDPHSHTPYTEEWNLTVQYQFVPSWVLEVGYLGSHGQRLLNFLNTNDALLRNSSNPAAFGLVTNSSANREARLPVVGLSEYSATEITNASSYYDGLLVTVQHQFSKGLFLKGAYTFSKSIDNDSASFNYEVTGPPGNQFIPSMNKGLSDFDQTHRLVFTYVYNLPGPKQGVLHHILGNWSISGITSFSSGFPFSITQDTLGQSLSGTDGYANVISGCNPYMPNSLNGSFQYINKSCFKATPTLGPGQTFGPLSPYEGPGNQMYFINANGVGQLQGNVGRNTLRGPFRQRFDWSIAKSFPIHKLLGESGSLQLRADFFNLFNHPVFTNPRSVVGDPGFGQIFSMQDIPRQVQVSGRITF
jgi:hypothetical protein